MMSRQCTSFEGNKLCLFCVVAEVRKQERLAYSYSNTHITKENLKNAASESSSFGKNIHKH